MKVRYSGYLLLLFFFVLFFLRVPFALASCQQRTYTECESGNATACLGTGSGPTHNVPKGDRAQVTLHSDCSYSCVDLGKCSSTSPTPTTSPSSGKTTVDVTFHIEGIDTVNSPLTSPTPGKHTAWPFTLSIFNGSSVVNSYNDIAAENTASSDALLGTFHNGSFNLGSLASGNYTIFVTTPFGSLKTSIGTTAASIISAKNNVLVPANSPLATVPFLTMGDINQDGKIDITDYGILASCFGDNATSTTCIADKSQLLTKFPSLPQDFIPGDLNDNGIVDGIDYNIFLRGFLAGENSTQ